ncbi:MAG: YigZ family protein [Bacteroidota bacterium]
MDTFFSISSAHHIETKEKASKFIAYIFPIQAEEEAKQQLDNLWQLHPKATHVCYAYRLGLDKNNYRANDDGEPSGTAGKPILGQIDAHQLTQVLIAVVRYYGGTKLGVSGLIQAYKEAAFEVIQASAIIEKEIVTHYSIITTNEDYNVVISFLKKQKASIMQQKFEENCLIDISISNKQKDAFFNAINELYQVNLNIKPSHEK